jgi:outer membrane immunogenic protein
VTILDGIRLRQTGCYLGANAGGAFVHNKDRDPIANLDAGSDSTSGFIGGGQVGCDYQAGLWVFGVQGVLRRTSNQRWSA